MEMNFDKFQVLVTIVGLIVEYIQSYFLLRFFYVNFPVFAIAADDVIVFIKGFYAEHGIWATLGFTGFICLAVWAFGEEAKRKERRKETMNQMMK